jgi:hypothetical protein
VKDNPLCLPHILFYVAYENGPGSMRLILLCFFSFLTGAGSCSAFQASIKTGESLHAPYVVSNFAN